MRVFTQVRHSSPSCFGEIFSEPEIKEDQKRKDRKQKLSLITKSKEEFLGITNKLNKGLKGRKIKDNLIEELEMIENIVKKRGNEKSVRKQEIDRSEKIFIQRNIGVRQKNSLSLSRKSCHSLETKHTPLIPTILSRQTKAQYQIYSRSTSVQKGPLDSQRKIQQLVSQNTHSSQILHEISFRPSFKRIQSFCKNIKKSFCCQSQQQIKDNLAQQLSFFKKIPSSQMPNEFAISYDISDSSELLSPRVNRFKSIIL